MKRDRLFIDKEIKIIQKSKRQFFRLSIINEEVAADYFKQIGIALAKKANIRFVFIQLKKMVLSDHQLTNLFSELSGKNIVSCKLEEVTIGASSSESLLKTLQAGNIKFTDILHLNEVDMPTKSILNLVLGHFEGFDLLLGKVNLNDNLGELAYILSDKISLEVLSLYGLTEKAIITIIRNLGYGYKVQISGVKLNHRNRYIEMTLPDILFNHCSLVEFCTYTSDPKSEAELDEALLRKLESYAKNDLFPIFKKDEGSSSSKNFSCICDFIIRGLRKARISLYFGYLDRAQKEIQKILRNYNLLTEFTHQNKFSSSCQRIIELWLEECLLAKDEINITKIIKAILSIDWNQKLIQDILGKIVMHILPTQPIAEADDKAIITASRQVDQKDQRRYETALICLLHLGGSYVHAPLLAHYLRLFCEGSDEMLRDYKAYLRSVSSNKKLRFYLNNLHDMEFVFTGVQPQRIESMHPERSVYTFYGALFNASFKLQINTEQKRHLTERVDDLEQQVGHMQQQLNQIMSQLSSSEGCSTGISLDQIKKL